MTDPDRATSTADGTRQRRLELAATVLLAAAAVATAWSSYQSAHWRGEQARSSSGSTAARIESAAASTTAGQLMQIDIATFTEWVDADVEGNQELADFYRRRFRVEFQPAFEAWLATEPLTNPDAPATPFEMPEYTVAAADEASRLNGVAEARTEDAHEALERADQYMLAVVLFATALFFAGISSKFQSPRREVLVGVGGAIFLGAAIWVVILLLADGF
jgi:hypothetical protein